MTLNIRRLGILIILVAVLLLGAGLVALSYTSVGISAKVGIEGVDLSVADFSGVPEAVVEDATALAGNLYGDYQEHYEDFVNQLLATYVEARDKDFVVIFNPGGWGWKFLDSSPGWCSIIGGINSELDDLGYSSLLLDYRRTEGNFWAMVDEAVELITLYPSKAEELAHRVEFLTSHVPDLNVIVTGESNGTVISDITMQMLHDNPRVYSIQTGQPFWHRELMLDRTLVLNDNGIRPDSFTRGDIPAMLGASLRSLLGLATPGEEDAGRILGVVRAPGHDYWWQYPAVYLQITDFLEKNFGLNQERVKN